VSYFLLSNFNLQLKYFNIDFEDSNMAVNLQGGINTMITQLFFVLSRTTSVDTEYIDKIDQMLANAKWPFKGYTIKHINCDRKVPTNVINIQKTDEA
jgi:hypothetical protein